jgi:ParB family transcriptional regulator, chromosome partitioning protein
MARKGGLGKGLDALIPSVPEFISEESAGEGTLMVSVERIIPNPRQPRQHHAPEELNALAESIKEHGILQPLIVAQEPGSDQYTLIAGERRLRAARMANLTAVPVIIRQVTDQQRLELALVENIQRADLTPLETAEAYNQLNEIFKLSHDEIAHRIGKSRVSVTNTIRLLKLPKSIQEALGGGLISEGHARTLLALTTTQAQLGALQTIINNNLSVRQTEDLVRRLSGEKTVTRPQKTESPEIISLEERLRTHLGTKVSLHHGTKGGSVVIFYYSDEELDSIINQILKE